ncbi:protein KRBA1 isoform X3 [Hemicordylus capensis]|uniref:protein KRBA1 isoform X3 n=1 Tax=Hemicordylus capensis TaxID=884348 RepID=UPI002302CC5F|nr:protein KRBA1 isoform X3 [Hemicordylus capensis]
MELLEAAASASASASAKSPGSPRRPPAGAGGADPARAWASEEEAATGQVQAQRGIFASVDAPELVTFEEIAVCFSAVEWSMLEGWQKELHKEVMQENYALLSSLGHSVPLGECSSLIHQLEGTPGGHSPGSSGGGESDVSGEELPFTEDAREVEGPWDLEHPHEGCLTPVSDGEGKCQSSLHLCALMKLVKEIPEFLYGATKASPDPGTAASSGGGAEAAADVPDGPVKTEARAESPDHHSLEGDLADISPSLSSHPDTPSSSTQGDWAASRIWGLYTQDVATNTEVAIEENLSRGLLKHEKEALADGPCQSRVRNGSLQTGQEEEDSCPAVKANPALERSCCPQEDSCAEGGGERDGAGPRTSTPQAPAGDWLDCRATGDVDLRRTTASGAGKQLPQEAAAEGDNLSLTSSLKGGGANGPDPSGTCGDGSLSSNGTVGERTLPEKVGRRAAPEGPFKHSSSKPARETAAEEKPLQGLLRCLKELIVHQPQHSHQASRKPSTGGCQKLLGHRRREVGNGTPPLQVKVEATDEDPTAHSQRNPGRERSSPFVTPDSNTCSTSAFLPGGGGQSMPDLKDGNLFAAVKMELAAEGSLLQGPERAAHAIKLLGAPGEERTTEETSALGVKIKTEVMVAEEEAALRGLKEMAEEEAAFQPELRDSGSALSGPEAGLEPGLWVPYSEEWSPATSPLHGLLNCLKEIPVPRPHPSKGLAGRRGGGGKERRKVGRRGKSELRSDRATPEKMCQASSQCHTPPALAICGLGSPLQGLERCLKELPPSARSHASSPAISSSIGSSPDRLPKWHPETGRWARKEEGLSQHSTPLQGLERCLKELPPNSPGQPPSPAISSSFSSSPEGPHRWTPDTGKWTRKEGGSVGRSRNSTPLQGLERCLKELPPHSHSLPDSPAVSSSISSSPEGLHRWTPETGKWTRKEEGLSRNSTPLQGLESCLKELPDTPHSPFFLPAVSSSFGSSSEGHCKPEMGEWSTKEEAGVCLSRIPPLQGLENCLREIPVSGRSLANSVTAASDFVTQKPRRAEAASRRPWAGGGPASSRPPPPAGVPGPFNPEAGVESSPLHRLMNCLKEIPIKRPSYLNTPSVSSSSSSCSEMERDQQSPGSGAWWDGSPDTCQGSEVDVAAGQKGIGSCRSPLSLLPSEEERGFPSTPEPELAEAGHGAAAASPLHGLESCLEDTAVSQMLCSNLPPRSAKIQGDVALEGPEGGVLQSHSANGVLIRGPQSCAKDAAARNPTHSSTAAQGTFDRTLEREVERRSHPEAPTLQSPHTEEVATESSPLQGLLRCLKEITARGPSPRSLSASSTPASDARGEARHKPAEEEAEAAAEAGRASREGLGSSPKGRSASRTSPATSPLRSPPREAVKGSPPLEAGRGPRGFTPTSSPVCGVRTCAKEVVGNGNLCVSSPKSPAHKFSAQRRSDSSPAKSGMKRSPVAARGDDSPAPGAASCSFQPQGGPRLDNPPKKRCPSLDPTLAPCGWGNGQPPPPECRAEVGGLGPLLSRKLDHLSADMSAICRDVSRLQSHMDRLEQDARGWVLELATLHMENRCLSEYVRRMEGRCRTLENRSRRNNLRMLGLPEGLEGSDAVSFLQKSLHAMLGLPLEAPALEIESARRVQGGISWDPSGRPRPLVFRLLRFADKTAILQAARTRPLSYAGAQVTILPDFCSSLNQRRRIPFGGVRRTRWAADLCFGPRHSSWWPGWTQGLREPLASSGPLAGEREGGRVPKGPGAENWATEASAGQVHHGACHSAHSAEHQNL